MKVVEVRARTRLAERVLAEEAGGVGSGDDIGNAALGPVDLDLEAALLLVLGPDAELQVPARDARVDRTVNIEDVPVVAVGAEGPVAQDVEVALGPGRRSVARDDLQRRHAEVGLVVAVALLVPVAERVEVIGDVEAQEPAFELHVVQVGVLELVVVSLVQHRIRVVVQGSEVLAVELLLVGRDARPVLVEGVVIGREELQPPVGAQGLRQLENGLLGMQAGVEEGAVRPMIEVVDQDLSPRRIERPGLAFRPDDLVAERPLGALDQRGRRRRQGAREQRDRAAEGRVSDGVGLPRASVDDRASQDAGREEGGGVVGVVVAVLKGDAVEAHIVLSIGEPTKHLRLRLRPTCPIRGGEAEAGRELDGLRVVPGDGYEVVDEALRDDRLRFDRAQRALHGRLAGGRPFRSRDHHFGQSLRRRILSGIRRRCRGPRGAQARRCSQGAT